MNPTLGLLLALSLGAPNPASAGAVVDPQQIHALLGKARLQFSMPSGFRPVAVQPNRAMEYDLALQGPDGVVEVRYAVRFNAQPRDSSKTVGDTSTDPNKRTVMVPVDNLFPSLVQSTILNITVGNLSELRRFDPDAAMKEFGTEEGFTTSFAPKAAGWNGRKVCMMVALRKPGASEAYVFFLFDDFEVANKHVQAAFHSLRFADEEMVVPPTANPK